VTRTEKGPLEKSAGNEKGRKGEWGKDMERRRKRK